MEKIIDFLDLGAGSGEVVERESLKRKLPLENNQVIGIDANPNAPWVQKADCLDYLDMMITSGMRANIVNMDFFKPEVPQNKLCIYCIDVFNNIKKVLSPQGVLLYSNILYTLPTVASMLKDEGFCIQTLILGQNTWGQPFEERLKTKYHRIHSDNSQKSPKNIVVDGNWYSHLSPYTLAAQSSCEPLNSRVKEIIQSINTSDYEKGGKKKDHVA